MRPRIWYASTSNPQGGCKMGPFPSQLEATQLAAILQTTGADGVAVHSEPWCLACGGAGVVGDGLCCLCVRGEA